MKNLGTYFLIAIVAILIIKIVWFPNEKEVRVEIPPEIKEAVKATVDNVNKNIDKKGYEHAVIDDKENIIKSFGQLDDTSKRKLDSVMNLLAIERKQFKEWRQYNTAIAAKDLPAESNDTGYSFKDKYASIEFISPKDTFGKGTFNFTYNAEINYAEYWKKEWFLGRKKNYIDFWIADPRATINGVKRVKIEPKPDNVKFDLNASGFYTNRLNLGVDGGLSVGRTRIGAGYYYDMVNKQWRPLVSLKYRILEF